MISFDQFVSEIQNNSLEELYEIYCSLCHVKSINELSSKEFPIVDNLIKYIK